MVINFINNFIKLKFKNIKNGDENQMKNDKTKLIIWAVVALVIGVIIGMI